MEVMEFFPTITSSFSFKESSTFDELHYETNELLNELILDETRFNEDFDLNENVDETSSDQDYDLNENVDETSSEDESNENVYEMSSEDESNENVYETSSEDESNENVYEMSSEDESNVVINEFLDENFIDEGYESNEDILEELEEFIFSLENTTLDESCAICLQTSKRIAVVLTCNHIFHKGCILEWINTKKYSCPLCRKDLTDYVIHH